MTYLYVGRESEGTKAQLATLTQQTFDDRQVIVGSSSPLVGIDVNHQRLHEGRAYIAYYVQNSGTLLANGASIDFVFAAGPGVTPHMTLGAFCGGDSELFLYEAPTTTGGDAFTPVNRNRTSANTSNVAMVTNPTVNTVGTELLKEFMPGGTKKRASGGGGNSLEYYLAPLTNYLVRLTNLSGSGQIAEIILEWYE